MDVVVHQAVAVLQVLALGYAVGGEDDVDLAGFAVAVRELFRLRGEVRQYRLECRAAQLERVGAVGASVHLRAFQAELALERCGQLVEEVVGRVRERAEHEDLLVAGVVRVRDLLGYELPQPYELGVALGRHRVCVAEKQAQLLDVVVEVLSQAQRVNVAQVNVHLAAGHELLGVIVVVELCVGAAHVVRNARAYVVEPSTQVHAAVQDAPQRDAEAVHGRLHALEHVHAHQVCDGGGAVHLALEVLAPRVAVAVLVLLLLVVAHVAEHLVLGERELGDHVVQLRYRRQLAACVDGRLERYRRPPRRERAGCGAVVLGDVLA